MNKMYAQRNGIPVDSTKQDRATRAVNKMIERDRKSRERSAQIINYYTNGRQDGERI